jgi:hypothetical protein
VTFCPFTNFITPSDGISQAFLSFQFVDVIIITDHDLFWNVGQANCILKYFENNPMPLK